MDTTSIELPRLNVHLESIDDATSFQQFLVDVRRHLHRHPELGFEEHRTSAAIREILEGEGLDVQGPIAGTGLYVDIRGGQDGPFVGYRADIDALPTQEASDCDYASEMPGVAHLCGHDAHTAVAIGTALLLQRNRRSLQGSVRVFFQPNEEGMPSGSEAMIEGGVLDGLEAVYAIHVDPTLDAGRVGLRAGPITASTDQFRIRVRAASSGHSARPHETVDTIWVATQIASALYQLVGRVTDARNAAVLTICRFRGGDAYNVIPEEVEFGGTLRATLQEDRSALTHRIEKVSRELGEIHDARVEVEIDRGSPPVQNDPLLVEHASRVVASVRGENAAYTIPKPSMGAEDFAHYLEHVPGVLLRIGTKSGPSTSYPLHDAHFDLDESVLIGTSRLITHLLTAHLSERFLG